MSTILTCPECETTLRSARAPQPGKKVRCPHCKAVFPITPAVEPPDEEELPAPRRQERPRQRSSPVPLVLIGVGAGVAVLVLLGGGLGLALLAYFALSGPRQMIVGTWQSTDNPPVGTIEFRRDGTFTFRPTNGPSVSVPYRFLDDKTLEFELPNPAREAQKALLARMPSARQLPQAHIPDTIKGTVTIVKLTRTELVTHSTSEGRKEFRRVE